MSDNLLRQLLEELAALLEPLAAAAEDPWALEGLLEKLGANDPRLTGGLLDGLRDLGRGISELKALLASQDVSLQSIGTALDALRDLTAAARALGQAGASPYPALGADLVNLVVLTRLRLASPLAYQLAATLGLVEYRLLPEIQVNGEVVRYPQPVERIVFDRVGTLFSDPLAPIREQLPAAPLATTADAEQTADVVVNNIAGVLNALGVPWMYGYPPEHEGLLGESAAQAAHTLLLYVPEALAGEDVEAGVCIHLSAADADDLGVVLTPFGVLKVHGTVGRWAVRLELAEDVEALAFGGGEGVKLLAGAATTNVRAVVDATLSSPETGAPSAVLGSADGTRLELGEPRVSVTLDASESGVDLVLSATTGESALVIHPAGSDGFLRSTFPSEGVRAKFNLGLTWSSKLGLSFQGAAGLDAALPVGISTGALTVHTAHLSLQAGEAGVAAEVSASVGLSIGPLQVLVERIGVTGEITFPEDGGALGVADLEINFKPPNGIGLAIDAPTVQGGGFLGIGPQNGEYSGMLELQIGEKISVKGIGVLTTKLPDGKGYSLVIIIFVENFTPIQLGFGFALTGIGGLFAINRTFDEDALRSGLKNHTLDSLMFPKDPIRNAPQIISNINRVFPPAAGHHLFGPMLQIAWGTPPLITAELALVLEFGQRLRLLILAQVLAILPRPENDLVRLRMDAVGVIDFDQGTASLDASLYASRLVEKFVLTGDMAMRLSWESPRNFALAVGGLHPAYNPPPNFPKLERIAIDLSSGDNPRFRCEAYFAITSNTLQFGARAELYAEAVGFSIDGEVGFDVLIQRDPFYFIADFSAQVQLKHGTTSICKVTVEGALSGPRPLHVRGKATIEVFWWDVSVSFDTTFLEGEKPPPALPIAVLPLLKEALSSSGNWVSTLPDGRRQMATFRNVKPVNNEVLLHPLGTLTVKQTVVPLNTPISRVGSAPLQGANVFTIEGVSVGTITNTVTDFFAPAQFFEMSDDAKLASPSFESMPAGVKFASDGFSFPTGDNVALETSGITFETHTITTDGTPIEDDATATEPYQLPDRFFARQYMFGAAGESELRRVGREKYKAGPGKFELAKESWGVVDVAESVPSISDVQERGLFMSYSEARRIAREEERLDPLKSGKVKVMRPSELK